MVASVPQRRLGAAGDDRAIVRGWLAATTDPLGRQQPLPLEQPQHPLAADLHAVLTTQPGPDLAVALASEWGGMQNPADQPSRSWSLIEAAGPGRAGIVAWRRA
jgi:hypothetical protein